MKFNDISKYHKATFNILGAHCSQDLYDESVLLAVEAFAHTLNHMIFGKNASQNATGKTDDNLDQCVVVSTTFRTECHMCFCWANFKIS